MPSGVGSRLYVPVLARLTRFERAYIRQHVGEDAVADFLLPTRYIGREDASAVLGRQFQIVYNFSSGRRDSTFMRRDGKGVGSYGAPVRKGESFSYRMLYEMLCTAYNGGVYFIDTYFEFVFPLRRVGRRYAALMDELRAKLDAEFAMRTANLPRRKDGVRPDMRYATRGFRLKDFRVWEDAAVSGAYRELAEAIRTDIITCLSSGNLPLRRQKAAQATVKTRKRYLGMKSFTLFFYASGRLIEHLNIYVNVAKEAA
jgi:hypothetical protein